MLVSFVRTPVVRRSGGAGRSPAEGGARDAMATKAVVVVEDDRAVAQLIQEVINDEPGYGAVTVRDGAKALAVLEAVHTDLVILDVDLPGLSGFDIYDWLRRRDDTRRVPVLFMSARRHAEELERRNIADVLRKPFHLDDLMARVDALLRPAARQP